LALWISRDLNLDQYLIDFEVPDRSYAAFPGRDEGRSPTPQNLQHNTGAIKSSLSWHPTAAGEGTSWR